MTGTTNATEACATRTDAIRTSTGLHGKHRGASVLVLALALAAPGLVLAPSALAQSDGATVVIVPADGAVVTDGVPDDAGTAQALADDDAPTDADADSPAPEPVMAGGGAAREGTEACVDILTRIEGDFTRRGEEANAALLTMAAADPLVLRMKDGSAVDLRPADAEAGPTENWFGDPPRRTQVGSAIDAMRGFSEAGNEAECLEAARTITASLNEWEGIEPVAEAMDETTGEDGPSVAPIGGSVGEADEGTPSGGASSEEAALTPPASEPDAEDETSVDPLLTPAEEADVSATSDDTGEGDDYGAPAATEQRDVTGAETESVETRTETDPAMGTTAREPEGTEAAALTDDLDDRTQEGPGAETPLAPLTTSDERNDAGATGETAASAAQAPRMRMVERPGRIIIQDGEGREVDPARTGVQFRTVPIE